MAAAALFYDAAGRILIVKPTYRAGWLLPGGSVEGDESPHAACAREAAEELGLTLPIGRPLCVEWQAARPPARPEYVKWIFDGGPLDAATLAGLTPQAGEIAEFRMVSPAEAAELLEPRIRARTANALLALERGGTAYLEDGRLVAG
jgi:8-oxo-dGTP pyrophosphatase MutT (NUDIX family)